MKKLTVLSVVVASLLLVGCGDETKEVAKEVAAPVAEKSVVEKVTEAAKDAGKAATDAVEKTTEVAKEAKDAVVEKATEVKDAVVEKATEVKEAVAEKVAGATDTIDVKACAGCHGANFEKKAMGKSKVVSEMTKADIVTALKGYKDGSYGGAMKGLMKGQVASYDDAKIEAVAAQIGK